MGGNFITGLTDPLGVTQAATKGYVDNAIQDYLPSQIANVNGTYLKYTDSIPRDTANTYITHAFKTNSSIDFQYDGLPVRLLAPQDAGDAVNKNYVDTKTLDTIALAANDVNANSHKITNLATPTLSTDATTKSYVDSAVSGAAAGGGKSLNQISTAYPTTGNVDLQSNFLFTGDAGNYAPDSTLHAGQVVVNVNS